MEQENSVWQVPAAEYLRDRFMQGGYNGHNESGIYFKAALSLPTVCADLCHNLTGGLRVTTIIITVIVLGTKLSTLYVCAKQVLCH